MLTNLPKKKLGIFHQELSDLILQNVTQKMEEEGLDPAHPKLKALLQGLSLEEGSEELALTQIVENYQSLLKQPLSQLIEKNLIEAFPMKSFVQLKMGSYFPRIYRGLPRLYHKEKPSLSQIKKDFSHLPSLKRQVLSKALLSLYAKCPVQGKLCIFTWVIHDGLGDFIAAVETQKILRGAFPKLEVTLIALIQKDCLLKLDIPENCIPVPYEKECPVEIFPSEALLALSSSQVILQIPTYYEHTEKLVEKVGEKALHPPEWIAIGEYGFVESSWFHPKSQRYCLGLHFLEKGIMIRDPLQAKWSDLENEEIRSWVDSKNRFYLAYLATAVGGGIYLHALFKSLENEDQDIDLCTPDLRWFIQFLDQQKKASRSLLEWDVNVQSIEILYQGKAHHFALAEKGKKVRILSPEKISQSDFRVLLALSEDFVAVRGDQSFSEAVSQGKPFYYDAREHARFFIKDLVALSENRIKEFPAAQECMRAMAQASLYQLQTQERQWVDETYFQELEDWTAAALRIGLSLQEPNCMQGFEKICQIIREEMPANSFLEHLVQRAFFLKQHHDLALFEEEAIKKFCSAKSTLIETILEIKSRI